ncbi:hypothetical protein PF008_g9004 [Phytophthora fragariae]|uniref:Uncharacterized protein n=1 Tax=Phytophthora fragariae TaxID=53985 RepID=A0A6G0RYI3_9STRA|nr:hypothetical protein PF008_g9004 [Phytophthora fragariae]
MTLLAAESMTLDAAHQLIDENKTGKVLRVILDKYAYSLATSADKVRAINTGLAYCGNVKNWLVDKYSDGQNVTASKLTPVKSQNEQKRHFSS